MILIVFILICFPISAYEDMEKGDFCQNLISYYAPEKIRDDIIADLKLSTSVSESEYITNTIWHTDIVYREISELRNSQPKQQLDHFDQLGIESISCIAGELNLLRDLPQRFFGDRINPQLVEIYLAQKDLFGPREDYLMDVWTLGDNLHRWGNGGTRHRPLLIHLMQVELEFKEFDYISPIIRLNYPHYIPMLEFFQRSTGLNHETLIQALRHEDYEVFSWAVKKISSQHITELYGALADAINRLIQIAGPTIPEKSDIREGNLRLFVDYRYLPFEDEVLVYEYTPHPLKPPPAWNLYLIRPNPKIKAEYQIKKSDRLY